MQVTVLKENSTESRYVTMAHCDIRKNLADSCYISKNFYYLKVPLSVKIT